RTRRALRETADFYPALEHGDDDITAVLAIDIETRTEHANLAAVHHHRERTGFVMHDVEQRFAGNELDSPVVAAAEPAQLGARVQIGDAAFTELHGAR